MYGTCISVPLLVQTLISDQFLCAASPPRGHKEDCFSFQQVAHQSLTKSSSPSTRPEDGSIAPSIVVLLNTPLILLPMRLIPKVSPLFDVFLWAESETPEGDA